MNNYYHKYLKYKHKYFNLLEKTKRATESDNNNVDVDEISTNIKKFKISNYKNFSRAGILAGLFNMYVSEPVYELNPNYSINSDNNMDNKNINKSNSSHNYNLRGVEFKLRRETDETYIGSYTPEIIRNLQSNGVSSEVIDVLIDNFNNDDIPNIELLNSEKTLNIKLDNKGKNIEFWNADNMRSK